MVKNTKKAATKGEQSILNFFPRAPASPSDSASRVTRSRALAATSPQTQPLPSPRKPLVAALQSSSASNCRADPLGSSPRKPQSHSHKATQIQTRSVSMKRPLSPDVARSSSSTTRSAENKPSLARRDTPRKKARLSSPGDISQLSTPSIIPSSQSDESELSRLSTPVTIASQVLVKETVKQWRKQALPPTPEPGDNSEPMDVDEERTLWSPPRPNTPGDAQEAISASGHILTPPYTDKSSDADDMPAVPPTPVALDSDTKTAQLIAQIKAQAAADAAARSSPELDPNVVPELSDSDDDLLAQPLFTVLAKSTTNASASASTSNAPQPQLRRSTRQRTSLGASSTGSPVSRRSRQSLSHELDSSEDESPRPRQPLPRARARPNPIAALLKDKQKEERGGGGSAALFAAELSLKGKGLMLEEMSLEDDDLDYDNLKNCERAPSSFSFNTDYSDDVFLDDEDRKKLYGLDQEEDGEQINSILKDDQEARIEEAKKADRLREGVPLWTIEAGTMEVDNHCFVPIFASAGNSSTLQMLSQAVQTRDFARATTILKSGAFVNLASVDHPEVMSDLCVLATSSNLYEASISGAAYNAALKLVNSSSSKPHSCKFSPSFVIRALLELGASPGYLESLGLRPLGDVHSLEVDSMTREAILFRIVTLVSRAAESKRIVADEIPSLVVALSLVAMDIRTSEELRRDIMATLNNVCCSIPLFAASDRDAESVVASRLVALSETYQAVNKAKLLSLFSGGTGATMRIARFVAYSILVDNSPDSITGKTYCDPAPLPPLLNCLIQSVKCNEDVAPSVGSVFAINNDTDYTVMKFYLYILGIATTNIKSYVELQMDRTRKRSAMTSKMKAEVPEVEKDLDLLETLLEELHASINDLRAAHLDRSRAKAVVKQLQMRIHYQHTALERAYRLNAPKAMMEQFLSKGKAKKATKLA